MNEQIFKGVAIGFTAGTIGYVVIRFWVSPIGYYRRLKKSVKKEFEVYYGAMAKMGDETKIPPAMKKRLENTRRLSMDLADFFNNDIPYWYKYAIVSRGEKPVDAASDLMALANMNNTDHLRNRMKKIEDALKF